MRKSIAIALIFTLVGWFANTAWHLPKSPTNPISQVKPRPMEKYTIENLSQAKFEPSEIRIEDEHLFSFTMDGRSVTGCINFPEGKGPFPVIVMFRGYVDQKQYKTCDGSKRAGEYFSKNGYITLAPDFLGYGGSDPEAENIFETRFQTYVIALTLLNSVNNLELWDKNNLFIWGHSNGGQIALTVLEITQKEYPTVLWAPVSKSFPYSILYYTDDSDDRGKLIRRELAKFEGDYDVEKYSLVNYLDRIKAPIQIHQGTTDDAVPIEWTNEFVEKLSELDLNVNYYKYPGTDHNLNPSWELAVFRTLTFYQNQLK